MVEQESRLLWDWHNEKLNIEGFLTDPLEWVAKELENACTNLPIGRPLRKEDCSQMKTLTDIIRFINKNKQLLTASK
jgi:hypothetical protein